MFLLLLRDLQCNNCAAKIKELLRNFQYYNAVKSQKIREL